MTGHQLAIRLGDKNDLAWAQDTVTSYHYLRRPVDPRARPMAYVISLNGWDAGLVMVGIPHATKCGGWWGYPGLPTQWQVVDLCRIYVDRALQYGGKSCRPGVVPGFTDRHGQWRPATATWAMGEVLNRVQRDRVSLWPPVFPEQPYHIRLAISYHDPRYHRGAIYRQMKWRPMYTDAQGQPAPGSSGKFGWCWPLPEPDWTWDQIEIRQPRTMRLPL